MSDDILELSPLKNQPVVPPVIRPSKTPDTFVPAGTFVRAVMLGGADASTGVNSQSNPTPVLFRLLDIGTLPNHQHSHLKDCVATAAADWRYFFGTGSDALGAFELCQPQSS